jgi:hypothetical protein
MDKIVFSAVKVHATNKTLEKDANGYYKVILGGFNTFNGSGDFYLFDGVEDLVENKSHVLSRRLKSGYLHGERGHPVFQMGMTKAQFYSRNLRIDIGNVSHHIRDIEFIKTDEDSGLGDGSKFVRVEAWVKPSGEHGDQLLKALENPDQNVAFSIRCFTKDEVINGVNIKKVLQIITWDWVIEPGIAKANEWHKLSMESYDLMEIDLASLVADDGVGIAECFNCSLEDADERALTTEIITTVKENSTDLSVLKRW